MYYIDSILGLTLMSSLTNIFFNWGGEIWSSKVWKTTNKRRETVKNEVSLPDIHAKKGSQWDRNMGAMLGREKCLSRFRMLIYVNVYMHYICTYAPGVGQNMAKPFWKILTQPQLQLFRKGMISYECHLAWYKFIVCCIVLISSIWRGKKRPRDRYYFLAIKNVSPDLDMKVVWRQTWWPHVWNKHPQILIRTDRQGICFCNCET